ncbi:hypothetical protein MMC07_004063 [Pseudocyphellaria aurata]|nr:hypothetical protein [Pseudocyphellaria aurata]
MLAKKVKKSVEFDLARNEVYEVDYWFDCRIHKHREIRFGWGITETFEKTPEDCLSEKSHYLAGTEGLRLRGLSIFGRLWKNAYGGSEGLPVGRKNLDYLEGTEDCVSEDSQDLEGWEDSERVTSI